MDQQKSLERKQHRNWASESADAFAHRIAFDFIAQIERYLAAAGVERGVLAERLGVSAGAVSQALNNPQNLKLTTIGKYCQALGLKASVVAYDDGDHNNELGLVNSEVFRNCWEKLDRPRDNWSIREMDSLRSGTNIVIHVHFYVTDHHFSGTMNVVSNSYRSPGTPNVIESTASLNSSGFLSLPPTCEVR